MTDVRRIYVEKKPEFAVEARSFYLDLQENLGIKGLKSVRIINRYDVAGISDAEYAQAREIIFSEPPVDQVYDEVLEFNIDDWIFAMEYLPGQYDQRADSAAQCVQILTQKERPQIVSAKVIILEGELSSAEFKQIKAYYINPVESREAALGKPLSLALEVDVPADVQVLEGFINKNDAELLAFMVSFGFAMSYEDLKFCQHYFRETEHRNPTVTEIRAIDTYWSDHCRHTTFLTEIEAIEIEQGLYTQPIEQAYQQYLASRNKVYGDRQKDVCLMDIAVMAMKELKQDGQLPDLDESEEINACSIVVQVEREGATEEWLVMFKNETHNHPTEIEPFGGAATCLGGAIRDPLSGRSYVYQAMRVTGSADPRTKIEDTLAGKLPQRTITTGAASGYSSYGNQIGLATGQVVEIYDEGFVAKRMEIGAVIAATPKENVRREAPVPGDLIILLGGKTGRDGCGGATGSSKEHTEESILTAGAEVQKGNPPEERKIQRLFRNPQVSTLIKRCNDFGAGGVAVAIGELTEGLEINLDVIPKKYEGLDGTELAISESQERMAVVVAREDAQAFIDYARTENLEANVVAIVTADNRLKMKWRGQTIVDISREFLNTNGVKQKTQAYISSPQPSTNFFATTANALAGEGLKQAWLANLRDLNVCSQKGLVERFDSTIGAGSVLLPFGGKYQITPAEGMIAKIPVLEGDTTTGTVMSFGYNPQLSTWSPFHGALYAVIEAVTKVVAMGGNYHGIRLTLQEYFEKLGKDASKWGKPLGALLGAFYAQQKLGIPAIGGKDSMSGTFKDLTVPPTLVAFAVNVVDVGKVISPEFKQHNSKIVLLPVVRDEHEVPDFDQLIKNYNKVTDLIQKGQVLAAHSLRLGGMAEATSKMCFGNKLGMVFTEAVQSQQLFAPNYGAILLELDAQANLAELMGDVAYQVLGTTQLEPAIELNGTKIMLEEAIEAWTNPLERIFPTQAEAIKGTVQQVNYRQRNTRKPALTVAKPRIFMPVFPGTNCEYDTAKAFEKAGGKVETLVMRNLSAAEIELSIAALVKGIEQAQIIMLPGGFSGGDEPDGSGKFIATAFRNPRVSEAVMRLLNQRDGLMLGICNGFQALIKLGLVPYGEIREITAADPTLTHNGINRHVSCMVNTKLVSTLSPWFSNLQPGEIHTIAVSHGEGRFMAHQDVIEKLIQKGQIATQYVDATGQPTYDIAYNPNGSMLAIEGITSPDGRILGKMGHSERVGAHVASNVPGVKDQQLFAAGVRYFS